LKKITLLLTTFLLILFTFTFVHRIEATTYTEFITSPSGDILGEYRELWFVEDYLLLNNAVSDTFNEQNYHNIDGEQINTFKIDLDYYLSSFVYYTQDIPATVSIDFTYLVADYTNCPMCRMAVPNDSMDQTLGPITSSTGEYIASIQRTITTAGLSRFHKITKTMRNTDVSVFRGNYYEIDMFMIDPYFKTQYGLQPYLAVYKEEMGQYAPEAPFLLYSMQLTIEYDIPISLSITDVGITYSSLPSMNRLYASVTDIQTIDASNRIYSFTYLGELNKLYSFTTQIPDGIDITGSKFTPGFFKVVKNHIYDENLYLIYVPNETTPMVIGGDVSKYLNNYYNYIINVSQSSYQTLGNVNVYGIVNQESNFNAFAYFYMDFPIDTFESITLQYNYAYKWPFIGWEPSNQVLKTFTNTLSSTNPPVWTGFLFIPMAVSYIFNLHEFNTIQTPTLSKIPPKVMSSFTNILNIDPSLLTDTNIYKIHLGQFDILPALTYRIDNLVILNFQYVYAGELIELDYSDINLDIVFHDPNPPIMLGFIDWIGTTIIDGINLVGTIPGLLGDAMKAASAIITTVIIIAAFIFLRRLKKTSQYVRPNKK
jgi:hypothetical protein